MTETCGGFCKCTTYFTVIYDTVSIHNTVEEADMMDETLRDCKRNCDVILRTQTYSL